MPHLFGYHDLLKYRIIRTGLFISMNPRKCHLFHIDDKILFPISFKNRKEIYKTNMSVWNTNKNLKKIISPMCQEIL